MNLIYASIFGAMTAFAAPAASEGARPHHEPGAGMCKMLECTDTQSEALTKVRKEQRSEMEDTRKDLKSLHEQMAQEFAKPTLDGAKLDQLQAQINGLRADMANARVDAMKEIHAVLTPAQRTKLADVMKTKGHGHKGKAWGRHHGKKFCEGDRAPSAGTSK